MVPNSSVNVSNHESQFIYAAPTIYGEKGEKILNIPHEIWKEIFLNTGIEGLCQSFTVSKDWNRFIKNSISFKEFVYHLFAFSPLHWNKFFGEGTVTDEEIKLAYKLLPETIGNILKSPCIAFPGKTLMETHMLVWIPEFICGKKLTINSFDKLLKQTIEFSKNQKGCRVIRHEIVELEGDKPFESGFVLLSKDVLPNSQNKTYVDQQVLVESLNKDGIEGYRIPMLGEAIICTIAEYLKSGKYLLRENPWVYTRCQESDENGQAIVGGFGSLGLVVDYSINCPWTSIGVIGVKRI